MGAGAGVIGVAAAGVVLALLTALLGILRLRRQRPGAGGHIAPL